MVSWFFIKFVFGVFGSIGGFLEGIIFRVCFRAILRIDLGILVRVGNSSI